MEEFFKYGIKASIPKSVKIINKRIAIVGAGPGGLSASTFLKRLGVKDVTIFEKESFGGGLLMTQISNHRLAAEDV